METNGNNFVYLLTNKVLKGEWVKIGCCKYRPSAESQFVKQPDLLILDEPFHGLDNHARWKARRIIDEYMYASDKRTLIMVTHYPEELPTCINRIKRL